jgi:hypothetical protein
MKWKEVFLIYWEVTPPSLGLPRRAVLLYSFFTFWFSRVNTVILICFSAFFIALMSVSTHSQELTSLSDSANITNTLSQCKNEPAKKRKNWLSCKHVYMHRRDTRGACDLHVKKWDANNILIHSTNTVPSNLLITYMCIYLSIGSVTVTKYTTFFIIARRCTLPKQCIYPFRVIPTINSVYFPKWHQAAGLCNQDALCCLQDSKSFFHTSS